MPAKKITAKRQKKTSLNFKALQPLLAIALSLTIVADIIFHTTSDDFTTADVAFYAWFSAISCLLLVGSAHILHKFIKRHEKYYLREAASYE